MGQLNNKLTIASILQRLTSNFGDLHRFMNAGQLLPEHLLNDPSLRDMIIKMESAIKRGQGEVQFLGDATARLDYLVRNKPVPKTEGDNPGVTIVQEAPGKKY